MKSIDEAKKLLLANPSGNIITNRSKDSKLTMQGVYTTLRTISDGKRLIEYEAHIQRLRKRTILRDVYFSFLMRYYSNRN